MLFLRPLLYKLETVQCKMLMGFFSEEFVSHVPKIILSKGGVKHVRVYLTLSKRQFATLSSHFDVTPKIEVPRWFQKYLYHKNISHHRNLGKCNFNIEKINRVRHGGRFGHSISTATVYAVGPISRSLEKVYYRVSYSIDLTWLDGDSNRVTVLSRQYEYVWCSLE